jgi:8-amino-7-oxononanoate synthase
LDGEGLLRKVAVREGRQSTQIHLDGRELVNFGSNDYLSLAADPRLTRAALEAISQEGFGSGASPLISGHGRTHRLLEERLACFEGTEAALVFSSGFAANSGTIAALVSSGHAVFTDRKNHASLLDGCRLSRADVKVYPHGDLGRLDHLLRRHAQRERRLIVTDSLFSMDGDLAPLAELTDLADRHHAMLMIDEAHATGVFGENGRGVAEHFDVEDRIDVRVGTLSKALGSVGGYVAGSRALIDWLANRARPYVFSTAGPAAASAAAMAALDVVRDEPQRRQGLLARAAQLRGDLSGRGFKIGTSASQIIPVAVGDSRRAVELSAKLAAAGLFVPAIRPPTVPEGEACLRISLTFGHTEEMIGALLERLAELC